PEHLRPPARSAVVPPHPATEHPSPDKIAAFALGNLPEPESAAVGEHLAWCEACAGLLDKLPSDPFLAAVRDAARLNDVTRACDPDQPTRTGFGCASPGDGFGRERPPAEPPPELASHPRYRLDALIGHGGMGTVYRAEHALMRRTVALKVINPHLLAHPGAADRFRQEVRAAAQLHHPNIVTAFDAGQVGPVTVLVMEYVEGRSLSDVLRDRGALPVAEACDYARQAALGLHHAHELGMVHRDVKPHNLMLTADGRVKILDFGLARFTSE